MDKSHPFSRARLSDSAQRRPHPGRRAVIAGLAAVCLPGQLAAQEAVALSVVTTTGMIADAARRIAMLGQARAGDRTMLDALLPAAQAADLGAAAEAARGGAAATAGMSARRGRARYVEGAGLGHVDAGARSVAEILSLLEALGTEAIP